MLLQHRLFTTRGEPCKKFWEHSLLAGMLIRTALDRITVRDTKVIAPLNISYTLNVLQNIPVITVTDRLSELSTPWAVTDTTVILWARYAFNPPITALRFNFSKWMARPLPETRSTQCRMKCSNRALWVESGAFQHNAIWLDVTAVTVRFWGGFGSATLKNSSFLGKLFLYSVLVL